MSNTDLIILTGETSGDQLGGALLDQLRKNNPHLKVAGIAGPNMMQHSGDWFASIEELNYFGFFEVVPHLPKILKRIQMISDIIIQYHPKVVLTIDAPDFNMRVIKQVITKSRRLRQPAPKFIHFVAPSVWAYRSYRAQAYAKIYDHLLALLPFEPPYFTKYGLKTTFVGHPAIELAAAKPAKTPSTAKHKKLVIGIFPGSRSVELKRHLPIIKQMMAEITPAVKIKIIIPAHKENLTNRLLKGCEGKYQLLLNTTDLRAVVGKIDFALVKSGTISLELAVLGIPMVVFYKVNQLSAMLAKRLLKINYVSLVNIIAKKEVIPELLQKNCTAAQLLAAVNRFINGDWQVEQQLEQYQQVTAKLTPPDKRPPSQAAAQVLQQYL